MFAHALVYLTQSWFACAGAAWWCDDSLSTVMYMSARARLEDNNFPRRDLLGDLRVEPEDDDINNRDERAVPLLAETNAEVEAAAAAPQLVENVIVVHDKEEVPANAPEASEVV